MWTSSGEKVTRSQSTWGPTSYLYGGVEGAEVTLGSCFKGGAPLPKRSAPFVLRVSAAEDLGVHSSSQHRQVAQAHRSG
jgi:hypothetical protein